jgi:gas vesicle protein
MRDQFDLKFLRQREDDAATRGFFGGLFLGILLGVVLTLVFAPRRGDETRAAVAGAAGDLKSKAADLVGRSSGPDHVNDHAEVAIEREITVPDSLT